MSVAYNPSIVTSGMLMCLDAANVKSYPGSGTTVTDIAGNGYTGTLVNAPTFSSSNQGGIAFNGSTQYMSIAQNTPTLNQISVELVCNMGAPSPNVSGFLIGRSSSYRFLYSTGDFSWVCSTTNNGWYTTGTTCSITATPSNWNHVVGTYDGSNLRIYLNGVLANTNGSAISGSVTGGSNLQMMQSDAGNVSYGNGTIAVARIYDTALSAANIKQNFNAVRGRYGI
jgi:hypothetical protein